MNPDEYVAHVKDKEIGRLRVSNDMLRFENAKLRELAKTLIRCRDNEVAKCYACSIGGDMGCSDLARELGVEVN